MKKIHFLRILPVLFLAILVSCNNGTKRPDNLAPTAHMVTAGEVIQTSNYTYVMVNEDGKDYWLAISSAEIKEGETYYWSIGDVMQNFKSRELNRTFAEIWFVQDFTDKPITAGAPAQAPSKSLAGRQTAPEQTGITVAKAPGGVTIAELFAGRTGFSGKKVKVAGQVVRFSPAIMNRNWVHIQDGTRDGDNYDLTLTTTDTVSVGQVVTFEGVVSLNKDFGAGYLYDLIIEQATQIRQQ